MRELIKDSYDEVLPYLQDPERCGEGVKAFCPAHNDLGKSLTMKRGNNNEAVCHCFAGCTSSAIFKALHDRMNTSPRFTDDKPKLKKEYGKEVARYNYTDEAGNVIRYKVRTDRKEFWWKILQKNAPLPLYNLNEVIEKNPIFLVEGEKDVLTLKKLGYGATNDRSKEGLSLDTASKYLSGKEIIILPDNDKQGLKYAREAFEICSGIAKSVKIIDLSTIWADMPEKADITDFVEHGFSIEQILEKARAVDDKPISKDPESPKNHPHAELWKSVEGYDLNSKNQIVYVKNEEERIPLCHGSIVITEVIYNNDGLNDNILFKCDGITEEGEHLPEVTIPAEEFDSLKWISKKWGCSIVPFGTQSTTQRLISGIKLSGRFAKLTYQKCHTGYVNDKSGKPIAYLHAGGSIGNQNLICELSDELHQYVLSGCSTTKAEQIEAFSSSLSLLKAHRESVTYPLLSFVYLPALAQINREVNGECGFCLYLRGKTQNGKSTISAFAMSHFGKFTSTTPPASFEDTANRNELLSFLLKDSVLWVDDFHPKGTKKERDLQNERFNRISRASGDRASRGRLNSNSELMKAYKPRCLYLVTGEDEPNLSQSGLARIFTIDVKDFRKADTNKTALEKSARRGLLSRAMCDYISYIIENYEAVRDQFESLYSNVISGTRNSIGENRLSIQASLLICSFDMWLLYALKTGLIDAELAEALSKKNRQIISTSAVKIAHEIKESDPAEKFIDALSTMISNREVEIREIICVDNNNELFEEKLHRIGWSDEEFYYLDKEKAYSAVKQKLESVDDTLGVSMKGLFNNLMESGVIDGDKNSYTIVKNINGKNKRVIRISRSKLDL